MLAQGEVMYPHPEPRSVPELGGFEVSAVELDSETDLVEKLLFCVCVWQPSVSLNGLKAVLSERMCWREWAWQGELLVYCERQRHFGYKITGNIYMH